MPRPETCQRLPGISTVPSIGTPARLRVQPQPEPLGQIDSIGAISPRHRLACRPRASISTSGPSIVTSRLPGRSVVRASWRRPWRSQITQERLAERADLGAGRAEHQLLAEDADVAPALAVWPRGRAGGGAGRARPAPGVAGQGDRAWAQSGRHQVIVCAALIRLHRTRLGGCALAPPGAQPGRLIADRVSLSPSSSAWEKSALALKSPGDCCSRRSARRFMPRSRAAVAARPSRFRGRPAARRRRRAGSRCP